MANLKKLIMDINKISIENYLHNFNQKENVLNKGIYKLLFKESDNFYIGSTTENFKQRFRRHINDLKLNKHCNVILQKAYIKYGVPYIEILEVCSSEMCIEREQYYIDVLNPSYNIARNAGNTLGVKMKPEILEKKSIKVDVFDLDGKFINTYKSITQACKILEADATNVTRSMRTETTSSNNYQFRIHGKYKEINPYEKSTSDKVLVYLITGEFYKEYPSKLAASKELNVDIGGIVKNIQGQFSCVKNYVFKPYEINYPLLIKAYSRTHTNQKKVKITNFYTKEVFEFDSFNKVPSEICYKNALSKGLKEYKREDFIIKNKYIIQTKAHKNNEVMSQYKWCANGSVSGDYGAFKKKHVGEIQTFTPQAIGEYIKNAGDGFKKMQDEREIMKEILINKRTQAELIGRMIIEEKFIESTQLNIIRNELNNPTYNYGSENSLWELYQFTTFSMKEIHPSLWMSNHIDAHSFFTGAADIISSKQELVLPIINQLELFEV